MQGTLLSYSCKWYDACSSVDVLKHRKSTHCVRKFNDALNDAVAKVDQRILMLNSCFAEEHFDVWGNISARGKKALWLEMDDLLERFDRYEIKLLPTPNIKLSRKKQNTLVNVRY